MLPANPSTALLNTYLHLYLAESGLGVWIKMIDDVYVCIDEGGVQIPRNFFCFHRNKTCLSALERQLSTSFWIIADILHMYQL